MEIVISLLKAFAWASGIFIVIGSIYIGFALYYAKADPYDNSDQEGV